MSQQDLLEDDDVLDELEDTGDYTQEWLDDFVSRILIFIEELVGHAFFDYQREIARRLIESVILNDGERITILQARQSGKTEVIANTIAGLMILLPKLALAFPDLLSKFKDGVMVGCFAPVDDMSETIYGRVVERLTSDRATDLMLDPEIDERVTGKGKVVKLRNGSLARRQTAHPKAKIEGKSYHVVLLDEAQDADEFVVNKSIAPMLAFYNGSMFMTGTPTTVKGVFYKTIQQNKRRQLKRGARQNHFEFNWKACNTPEAPIWMGDFSFKPLGEVQVGDEVIGWEWQESKSTYHRRTDSKPTTRIRKTRRLTRATVLDVIRREAPIYKVTLASGRVIRCTSDHRWLSGKSKTAKDDVFVYPEVGRQLVNVVNPTPALDPALAYDAGWLGGMWDGEGSGLRIAQDPNANPEVYARIPQVLDKFGIEYTARHDGYYMLGGRQTLTDFLNWTDPVKRGGSTASEEILRGKFMRDTDEVVAMEPDGVGEVISMETTTGNYVAWGYASKNCARNNPNYGKFVRKEMLRLGEESDEFQLAYNLRWLLDRGMFTTEAVLDELGDVSMELVRAYTRTPVVVGIDPARVQDSTVVTVCWVGWDRPDEFGNYEMRVLNWLELTGMDWEEQYFRIVHFLKDYNVLRIGVDANGVGDAVAQRLQALMPGTEVVPLPSDQASQSTRWKHLMQLIERRMVGWPAHAHTRRLKTWKRFRQQMEDLEKVYKGNYMLAAAPDEADAHDDFADSLAIATVLTKDWELPTIEVVANPFVR